MEVDLAVHQRAQDGHVDRHEGQHEAGGHASIEAVPDEGQRQEPGEGGDREHVPDPQRRSHSSPAERHEELAGGGQQRRVDVALVERPPLGEVEGRPHVVAGVGVLAALAKHVRVQEQRQEAADRDEAVAGPEAGTAEEREHETAREPDEPDRGVGQLQARDRAHLDESGEHLGALQRPAEPRSRRRTPTVAAVHRPSVRLRKRSSSGRSGWFMCSPRPGGCGSIRPLKTRASLPAVVLASGAVLAVLYAGLCKALLFHGLEYFHTTSTRSSWGSRGGRGVRGSSRSWRGCRRDEPASSSHAEPSA